MDLKSIKKRKHNGGNWRNEKLIMLDTLFNSFDNIIVFDVETTGLDCKQDEIIEIAAIQLAEGQDAPAVVHEIDTLVKMTPGRSLPGKITEITGITERQLTTNGIHKNEACAKLVCLLHCQNPLIAAYNAQFDLNFLYHFLSRFGEEGVLKNAKFLDVLTIYKDRRAYPHKLSDAAVMYSLDDANAHRALVDTKMTYNLLCEMWKESDDLAHYINLFGYNPKYGVSGQRISSIRYMPQSYDAVKKLYET